MWWLLIEKETHEMLVTQLHPAYNLGMPVGTTVYDNGRYLNYGPFSSEEIALSFADLKAVEPV
jgi:hypothetical protein